MRKTLICLFLTLFVCTQAAIKFRDIKLNPNTSNLFEEVSSASIADTIRRGQETGHLPTEAPVIEKSDFSNEDFDLRTDLAKEDRTPISKTERNTTRYFMEFTLKFAVNKTEYLVLVISETDEKNTTITSSGAWTLAIRKFDIWPGVSVLHDRTKSQEADFNLDFLMKNDEASENAFVAAFVNKTEKRDMKYPNIYYQIVDHKLIEFRYSERRVGYVFNLTLKHNLTGQVHNEEVLIKAASYGELNRYEIFRATTLRGEQPPLIPHRQVYFYNTTKLTYNPLVTLTNATLFKQLEEAAKAQIVEEGFKVFGKNITGRFEFKKIMISAGVFDHEVRFTFQSRIHAEPRDWVRKVSAKFQATTDGSYFRLMRRFVQDKWVLLPLHKSKVKPVWID